MAVTKTQGAFPDDGSDAERRRGPSAHQWAQTEEAAPSSEAAPAEDAMRGPPPVETAAAAGVEASAAAAPRTKPKTTGVIFVHGIGSQKQAETLLQWSAPIIEVITDWKRWFVRRPELVRDPVEAARIDFADDRPTIDLSIPAATVGGHEFPEARWILTESWWAAKVASPLSSVVTWVEPR